MFLNTFSIAGRSIEKSSVSSIASRHLVDRSRCSSTPTWHLLDTLFVKLYEIQFQPMLMCLCRVSFLTTLDLYKAYFRGRHIREYKENICKRWLMPYSLWKKLLHLYALGFCNQVLLDFHCWWSEELRSQHLLQVSVLVTYWESRKKGGVHILKSLEVLKR